MKFKILLLITFLLPTLAIASAIGAKGAKGTVGSPEPAPITIKPSPPPNQQPKNNVGVPQGAQGPQHQVMGPKVPPATQQQVGGFQGEPGVRGAQNQNGASNEVGMKGLGPMIEGGTNR